VTPHYFSFSNIIIDDIVLWDGRTLMGTLGGSGTHALVGMRIWSDSLGFVASVGPDFQAEHWAQLERMGLDLRGVVKRPHYQTARAWQLVEPDERRHEVLRTDFEAFYRFTPQFEEMPPDYRQARGVHVQWGRTFEELLDLLQKLRQANPAMRLVWEPVSEHHHGAPGDYKAVFEHIALISPDRQEALQITRQPTLETAVKTMLAWGVPCVALRMGAAGSQAHTATGQGWYIPAVPTTVMDTTGAGDAYCGGFLVGLGEGLEPLEAGLRATVSASFALEQFGVPVFDDKITAEAERRLAWARERIEAL
jgi:sugar/nucleoside kinase (ribokinase family)